jgi:hypothetical protein
MEGIQMKTILASHLNKVYQKFVDSVDFVEWTISTRSIGTAETYCFEWGVKGGGQTNQFGSVAFIGELTASSQALHSDKTIIACSLAEISPGYHSDITNHQPTKAAHATS